MSARYLIRLDDACHTQSRARWGRIEDLLDRHAIRPIVAVTPDNQDPKLAPDSRDEQFWDKVRSWQARGWTVAMHGHTHVMRPTQAKLLVPFYERSEFAGLSTEAQAEKIDTAWRLFLDERVTPQVWVAPAHSFDVKTLDAVRSCTSIRVVSDGIACDTYRSHGFSWVPQQLWGLSERSFGLWTVCLHPNTMDDRAIDQFDAQIRDRFRDRIIDFTQVKLRSRGKTLRDHLYAAYFWRQWNKAARARR